VAVNPFVLLSYKLSCRSDAKKDMKICGKELGEFVPTPFARSHGATGSQAASYRGLAKVLEDLEYSPGDSFIDIGCGKGRVLAYLAGTGYPGRITGVELNPQVAYAARSWSARYPGIEVIEGDAFKLDYNEYNVLFMYRPMETDAFISFIYQLEQTLTHSVKLYYYADSQSGYFLNDRQGWNLIRREDIYRVKGFYIHKKPQRFSVWEYRPDRV